MYICGYAGKYARLRVTGVRVKRFGGRVSVQGSGSRVFGRCMNR